MVNKILNNEQIIKLIEYNLDNKFKYYVADNISEEKRPFGNSGYNSIFEDICLITKIDKKFTVKDEDELYDLKYEFVIKCFSEIKEWIERNEDNFIVKLEKKEAGK